MAHVDAEVAGVRDRRAGDAHVHLGGAGVADQLDERPGGRAAHERVVDHHDPLAGEVLGEGVELQRHAAVADLLRRLDERAADVAVLDQPVVERDAAGPASTRWRRGSRSRARGSRRRRRPATRWPARRRAAGGRGARCGRPTPSRGGRSRRTRTCSGPARAAGASAWRRCSSAPCSVTISPGWTSLMSTQPSVDRAHVSLATAWPPCGRRPTDSGRKPHGSRTAITRSAASSTSEKAPFHAGSVRSMRSSHVGRRRRRASASSPRCRWSRSGRSRASAARRAAPGR